MSLTLLSGVVRNRKQMTLASAPSKVEVVPPVNSSESPPLTQTPTPLQRLKTLFSLSPTQTSLPFCRAFTLRVHKFSFQWDLALHLSLCLLALSPFLFTGDRRFTAVPIGTWCFYHFLFLVDPQQALLPRFARFKTSLQVTLEELFSPKLLPVLSVSYLLVALSLGVTGHRLGGAPLCFRACGACLASWSSSIAIDTTSPSSTAILSDSMSMSDRLLSSSSVWPHTHTETLYDGAESTQHGCGYANGAELLTYYTLTASATLLFCAVLGSTTACLAWRITPEAERDRDEEVRQLHAYCPAAHTQRRTVLRRATAGLPGDPLRPEGGPIWVFFGITAAVSLTLLGWQNARVLRASRASAGVVLLYVLYVLTLLACTLVLHLAFFGRVLALYQRNHSRVCALSEELRKCVRDARRVFGMSAIESSALSVTGQDLDPQSALDVWWNCRTFVLNDDLSLDYDLGGLAVSAAFVLNVCVFCVLLVQVYFSERGAIYALLEAPGSYCAYAVLYITCCLMRTFTVATHTYEEQQSHIAQLRSLSIALSAAANRANSPRPPTAPPSLPLSFSLSVDEGDFLYDDGPLFIDDSPRPTHSHTASHTQPHTLSHTQPHTLAHTQTHTTQRSNTFFDPLIFTHSPTSSSVPRNFDIEALPLLPHNALSQPSPKLSLSLSPRPPKIRQPVDREDFFFNDSSPEDTPKDVTCNDGKNVLSEGVVCVAQTTQQLTSSHNRQHSQNAENFRQCVVELITQIQKYDPYPCILGIPVMPALFNASKIVLFVSFAVIGARALSLAHSLPLQ